MKPLPSDEHVALQEAAEESLARGALVSEHVALLEKHHTLMYKLEGAHRELDKIIYLASHDLRAPLRGIAHLSAWIEEDIREALTPALPTDGLEDKLKLLRSRVSRLERLINGLLAYSRAGRGIFGDAREQAADCDESATLFEICQALARVSPEASKDSSSAAFEKASGDDLAPVEFVAGPGSDVRLDALPALRLILGHLIENAARHARIGAQPVRVVVSAKLAEDTPGECRYEVTIADDGRGIEPRHHARIWDLFQTLEPRDRCETAGVGLAIVRRVVAQLGGTVGLDSQLGAGAAFRFSWPGLPLLRA